MKSTKQVLNYKQQKIQEILQDEKQNGNDFTKKEIIDKIREVLEKDYQQNEYKKERRLREEEIRRIRKLRMDGKITAEEEEYLIQNANKNELTRLRHDAKTKETEDVVGFNQTFQLNPTCNFRTRSLIVNSTTNEKQSMNNDTKEETKNKSVRTTDTNKESGKTKEMEGNTDNESGKADGETQGENSNAADTTEKNENTENEEKENDATNDENKENVEDLQFKRELSEMSFSLINENDLDKLYDLAEKMIFLSSKK